MAPRKMKREKLIAKMVDRDLYATLKMFEGQPEGSQVELNGHFFTGKEIGLELYKRGRVVPAEFQPA